MSPCKDLSSFEPCLPRLQGESCAPSLFLLVLEAEKMSWPRGAAYSPPPNVIAALCNQVTVWLSLSFW